MLRARGVNQEGFPTSPLIALPFLKMYTAVNLACLETKVSFI